MVQNEISMTDAQQTSKDEVVASKPIPKPAFRKGALVRVNRKSYESSLEAQASDGVVSEYIFNGPGELLAVKGDYAQVRWRMPVPDVWLRVDQLESWS